MSPRFFIPCLIFAGVLGSLTAEAAATTVTTSVTPAGEQSSSRTVSFGDLNLANRQGLLRLYSRIRSAAREVCEPPVVSFAAAYVGQMACEKRAIEQAVADVRSSQLTTLHMSMTNSIAPAM
jgi:UrcA family protein